MSLRFLILSIFFYLIVLQTPAVNAKDSDSTVSKENISKELSEVINNAKKEKLIAKPIGDLIVETAKYFLGKEYVAASLEKEGDEHLVCKLDGFDCTTFVENVLAISRIIKKENPTLESYKKELTLIRYRNGIIDLYPSRLHYFSDWIFDNSKKKIIADVTKSIGGLPINFNLNFMSNHPQFYKQLTETPEFVTKIKRQEEEISKREYSYIPTERINRMSSEIKNGDIIAFTTSIKGLDVSHTGIAIKDSLSQIHLLHASSTAKKVIISAKTLADYAADIKKNTGIIVLRAIEP